MIILWGIVIGMVSGISADFNREHYSESTSSCLTIIIINNNNNNNNTKVSFFWPYELARICFWILKFPVLFSREGGWKYWWHVLRLNALSPRCQGRWKWGSIQKPQRECRWTHGGQAIFIFKMPIMANLCTCYSSDCYYYLEQSVSGSASLQKKLTGLQNTDQYDSPVQHLQGQILKGGVSLVSGKYHHQTVHECSGTTVIWEPRTRNILFPTDPIVPVEILQ